MTTTHWFGPNAGAKAQGKGHPVMFGKMRSAELFDDFPEGGGLPSSVPPVGFRNHV